jgi:hypothetical protein
MIKIREAAETLAQDYSLVRCHEYKQSWKNLLTALSSHEPVIRYFAIQVNLDILTPGCIFRLQIISTDADRY